MPAPPPRVARLVLVRPSGALLGALPPVPVSVPWWQEAGPVVAAVAAAFGLRVTLLRILDAELPAPHGGAVSYLAETNDPVPPSLEAWSGELPDDPLRLPWARPGGPEADLAWAERELELAGAERDGPAEQVRSWNLSSLWRLPLRGGGAAWLKHVPPFLAHEGAILERLTHGPVPRLIARDGGRVLMSEVAGEDLYDADPPLLEGMVERFVELQRAWIGRQDELLGIGLPDWRAAPLAAGIGDVVERTEGLTPTDRRTLAAFVDELPARFEAIAATGLGDTLVHGDFHPGNVRGDGSRIVLLDWGDSGVGHPLLDQPAFLDRIPGPAVERIRERWRQLWTAALPGADPGRAAALLAPIAAARQAVVYRRFLDRIEPSEHPYHASDPADWLSRTAGLLRESPTAG